MIQRRPAVRSAWIGLDSSWPRGLARLVLATESAARRLGLEPQAELVGWSTNSDGYHMAMPCRERIRRCLETALARAELSCGQVDYYNAHGTSTSVNDRVETQVLKDVFGDVCRAAAGELD